MATFQFARMKCDGAVSTSSSVTDNPMVSCELRYINGDIKIELRSL